MNHRLVISWLFAATLMSCETTEAPSAQSQPTLVGNWRFSTEVYTGCTNSSDNKSAPCSGTASQCGVLTFTETTWLFSQKLPSASSFVEGGGYVVTSNVITLTGGSSTPNSLVHTVSGSAVTFTGTSVVFKTSNTSSGCSITIAFSKHNQPFNPLD